MVSNSLYISLLTNIAELRLSCPAPAHNLLYVLSNLIPNISNVTENIFLQIYLYSFLVVSAFTEIISGTKDKSLNLCCN